MSDISASVPLVAEVERSTGDFSAEVQNSNLHAHTHGRQRSSATRSAHATIACRLQEQRSSGRPSHLRHPRTPKTHFLSQLDNISTLPLLSHSLYSTFHSTRHPITHYHSAHLSCGLMMFRSPSSCPKMIFWRSKRSIGRPNLIFGQAGASAN